MKVLFIERSIVENGIVDDQISRINNMGIVGKTLSVNIGHEPFFHREGLYHVRCPFFPKIERVKGWLFARTASAAVYALIENLKCRPEIIHSHFAYPEGLAAMNIATELKIPYVITARGDDVLLYPARCAYLRKTVEQVIRNAAAVICVSEHIGNEAVRMGAAKENICHIPDGIDETVFIFNPESKLSRNKIVLFAGSFLPVKNPMRMLEAFSVLSKIRTDLEFRLAGEGPLKTPMLEYCRHNNLSDKTRFLGQLSTQRLAEEMRSAYVLCLPSISEGWPNVVMEAMASGTPTVGASIGGIPEQIISDDYGYLCNPYSVDDITSKLELALDKVWDRAKLKIRGRMYTRNQTAVAIADLYRITLNRFYAARKQDKCAE